MNFPEKMTFHPKIFEETISKSHPGYEDLLAYRSHDELYFVRN